MKQVWILNHYAQEPGGPGGTRHFNLAEKLVQHNWHATVIASSVELNSGRQRLNKDEYVRHDTNSGVSFLWIRTPEYDGNGGGRVLNMVSYTFRVLLPSYTKGLPRPNVIIGSSVHPFAAWAGAILARRYRVPFVFEVRDLWPQTLIDMGRLSENSLITWVLRKLENWLYQQASRIVVLLPGAVDYISPLGIKKEQVVWIPNGVDLSLFPITSKPIKSNLDEFQLMYFGAHGQANGLDNLLQAMKQVSQLKSSKTIKLRLIGDGPMKQSLMKLANELGLSNISFEPPVPKNEIPQLAASADAFVFNLIDAPVFRYGISSNKLFDFMAAARPILFCCNASNNPVMDAQAGVTVPPGKLDLLAKAIIDLSLLSEEKRLSMGNAARSYVEVNHSFNHLAGRLAQVLDRAFNEYK